MKAAMTHKYPPTEQSTTREKGKGLPHRTCWLPVLIHALNLSYVSRGFPTTELHLQHSSSLFEGWFTLGCPSWQPWMHSIVQAGLELVIPWSWPPSGVAGIAEWHHPACCFFWFWLPWRPIWSRRNAPSTSLTLHLLLDCLSCVA